MQKDTCLDETWYSGVFGIADYESEHKIEKFKMVNPHGENFLGKFSIKI